ncbi:MAG: c-type cytochrome domain-containing protein, partial [Verrucomicrobiota bacterium]
MARISQFVTSPLIAVSVIGFSVGAESDNTQSRFLEAHCIRCHGEEKQKGKVALHDLSFDFANAESADMWLRVLEQLTAGVMPPPDEEKLPSDVERNSMIEWIDQQLLTTGSGEAYRKKLLAPEYGNWVNHEKLFSGEIDTRPFSPSRLWRFSPEIFEHKGFGRAKSPYTYVTSERGIRDYAALSIADQSTVQMTMIVADSFLAHRESRGEFKDFADDKPTPDDQVLRDWVWREFGRVVGRQPSEAEREKYEAFLKKNIETGGNLDGLKPTIKAMFLSPESIYRMEFGLGEVDEHGRRHLSPDELAHSLAFALTDQTPDRNPFIRKALETDKLATKDDVALLVRQLLDEQLMTGHWDRRNLPRVMRFFDEFFGFHRAGTVFKDNDRRNREKIPQWNTSMLVHDARMLIEHVLKKDKDVIAELLTTNEYFIAHPGDNEYAKEFYEQRIAEITDPGYIDAQVEKRRGQIEKDFNFKDMPEKAAKELERSRKEAERMVARYTTAIDKGMYPHPSYPFSQKSRGIADLIYIEPYNLPSSNRVEEQ